MLVLRSCISSEIQIFRLFFFFFVLSITVLVYFLYFFYLISSVLPLIPLPSFLFGFSISFTVVVFLTGFPQSVQFPVLLLLIYSLINFISIYYHDSFSFFPIQCLFHVSSFSSFCILLIPNSAVFLI